MSFPKQVFQKHIKWLSERRFFCNTLSLFFFLCIILLLFCNGNNGGAVSNDGEREEKPFLGFNRVVCCLRFFDTINLYEFYFLLVYYFILFY